MPAPACVNPTKAPTIGTDAPPLEAPLPIGRPQPTLSSQPMGSPHGAEATPGAAAAHRVAASPGMAIQRGQRHSPPASAAARSRPRTHLTWKELPMVRPPPTPHERLADAARRRRRPPCAAFNARSGLLRFVWSGTSGWLQAI